MNGSTQPTSRRTRPDAGIRVLLGLAALALLAPAPGDAEEMVAGTINGLRCVTDGVKCPVDEEDPVIATLADFVLQTEGDGFLYLHNVDIDVKENLVLKPVRVTGEVNRRYRSMEVARIEVRRDGDYRTVWTPARDEDDYRQPGATRR